MLSHVQLSAALWTVALSVEFSRQEYQSGLPFSPPGDLPDPKVEPVSPALVSGFLLLYFESIFSFKLKSVELLS